MERNGIEYATGGIFRFEWFQSLRILRVFHNVGRTPKLAGGALQSLRILRVFRVGRTFKLLQYLPAEAGILAGGAPKMPLASGSFHFKMMIQ